MVVVTMQPGSGVAGPLFTYAVLNDIRLGTGACWFMAPKSPAVDLCSALVTA